MAKEYRCTHPDSGVEKLCNDNPIGIVAYIDKRMLATENDPSGMMAGMLAYLGKRDIENISGNMHIMPRIDIACTRYVVQTLYPMTLSGNIIEVIDESTGNTERSILDENSTNIQLLTVPFPEGGKDVAIDWMKKFQPNLRKSIMSQLIDWEETFHAADYVRPEMYQFLEIIQGERLKLVIQGFENEYQVLLDHLEHGTPLDKQRALLPPAQISYQEE